MGEVPSRVIHFAQYHHYCKEEGHRKILVGSYTTNSHMLQMQLVLRGANRYSTFQNHYYIEERLKTFYTNKDLMKKKPISKI